MAIFYNIDLNNPTHKARIYLFENQHCLKFQKKYQTINGGITLTK